MHEKLKWQKVILHYYTLGIVITVKLIKNGTDILHMGEKKLNFSGETFCKASALQTTKKTEGQHKSSF
jgi:hypothetical protein